MNIFGLSNIEQRKIALIGEGKMCRRFYLQFGNILNINYIFLTNIDSESYLYDDFLRKNPDIKALFLNERIIEDEELLLVLCCPHQLRQQYDHLLFNRGIEWGSLYVDYLYIIQYYRFKYKTDLTKKNIWIFGAGNSGKYFYEEYRNVYNICGFVSNYSSEKEYLGFPVIRPEELLKSDDLYTVICSDADDIMSSQMDKLGFIGGRDYAFDMLLPKRLFVVMGICQIAKVSEALSRNKMFRGLYDMVVYLINAYEPFSDADNHRIKEYGCFCDAVFYSVANGGLTELRNFAPVVNRFYKKAFRFFMPYYYFKGQIIQATDDVNFYAMRELKAYSGRHYWFRGDQEINRMVEEGCGEETIIERVTGQYWSKQRVLDNFAKELKKVEVLDRLSSFKLRPFIDENYRKILIFIDGTHFSYQLCIYLANKIAESLHVGLICEEQMNNERENIYTGVMPIYPCVKNALGMETEDYYQFYNIEKDLLEYIDIKEYIRRYVGYVKCVKDMREKFATNMAF